MAIPRDSQVWEMRLNMNNGSFWVCCMRAFWSERLSLGFSCHWSLLLLCLGFMVQGLGFSYQFLSLILLSLFLGSHDGRESQ